MIPLMLAGKGVQALSLFKKHWGKIISFIFVVVWIWITLGLYNSNQELNLAIGAADSAVNVCIAQRANMDNVLLLLKADIALIQADNATYKAKVADARVIIEDLEAAVPVVLTEIDKEVLPESCEGTMDWMLKKALE